MVQFRWVFNLITEVPFIAYAHRFNSYTISCSNLASNCIGKRSALSVCVYIHQRLSKKCSIIAFIIFNIDIFSNWIHFRPTSWAHFTLELHRINYFRWIRRKSTFRKYHSLNIDTFINVVTTWQRFKRFIYFNVDASINNNIVLSRSLRLLFFFFCFFFVFGFEMLSFKWVHNVI